MPVKQGILLITILFYSFCGFGQDDKDNIAIDLCNKNQNICVVKGQKTVKVCLRGRLPKNFCGITRFEVVWDISKPNDVYKKELRIPPNGNEEVFIDLPEHEYNIEDFTKSSEYEKIIIPRIITYNILPCPGKDSINRDVSEFSLINTPAPRFTLSTDTLCANSSRTVSFNNQSTPSTGSTYEWDYGDGSPKGTTPSHIYNTKGVYTITLTAKNNCGAVPYPQTLVVIDPPKPVIKDSISIVSGRDTLICLSQGGIIRFSGESSTNSPNVFEWQITGGNYTYLEKTNKNSPRPKVQFISEGTYTISLRVRNACGEWSTYAQIKRKVVKDKNISLPDFTSCTPILVKIPNPETDVTYILDGKNLPPEGIQIDTSNVEHTLSASSPNGCGAGAISRFYVRGIKPVSITLNAKDTLCIGSPRVEVIVNDPSTGGKWDTGTPIETSGGKYYFRPATAGVFKLTYSNAGKNCASPATASKTIVVIQEPVLKLSLQADTCKAFTYKINNPVPKAVYTLNGNIIPPTGILLDTTQTPYIVKASLQSACNNTLTDQISFKVRQFKPVNITPVNPPVCLNSGDILLTVSDPDGIGDWLKNDLIKKVGNNYYFTPTILGPYTIKYAGGKGICEVKDEKTIKVEGVSGFAKDTAICHGASFVVLKAEPKGGVWKIAGNSIECAGSSCIKGDTVLLANIKTENTLKFTYEAKAGNGCPAVYNATLSIGNPKADFTIDSNICSGQKPVIINQSSNASSYQWYVNNVPKSTDTRPQLDLLPGKSIIRLVANAGGCSDNQEKTVTVTTPADPIDFNLITSGDCSPVDVTFKVTGTNRNDVAYVWDLGDGTSFNGFQPPPKSYINQGSSIKKFAVSVKANSNCGTPVGMSADFNVQAQPKAELGADSLIRKCSPAIILFTNRSMGSDGTAEWDFGDGTPKETTQKGRDTISHRFEVLGIVEKTFYVKIKVKNSCRDAIDSLKVVVSPKSISAYFSILPGDTVCTGAPVTFKDSSTPVPFQVSWELKDGGTTLLKTSGSVITYKFKDPDKTYDVIMTASSACKSFDTRTIKVRTVKPIKPEFEISKDIVCEGEPIQFKNKTNNNVKTFYWNFNDGSPIDSTSPEPTHKFSKSNYITFSIKDVNGCISRDSIDVTVRPKPVAQLLSRDTVACSSIPIFLKSTNKNMAFWRWYVDGQIYVGEFPEIALKQKEGKFDVTLVINNGSCQDSTLFPNAISVLPCEAYYPEAFSPDGPKGKYWTLFGKGIKNVEMFIYNRWGEIIFYANDAIQNDQEKGWDGTYKGEEMPTGVYPYQAKVEFIDGRTAPMQKGFIKLVREKEK